MLKITQKQIADSVGIDESFICHILAGRRRPSWAVAKKLAEATGTTPDLWLDKSPEEIKAAING